MSPAWVVVKVLRVSARHLECVLISYLEPSLHLTQNTLSIRDLDDNGMLLSN